MPALCYKSLLKCTTVAVLYGFVQAPKLSTLPKVTKALEKIKNELGVFKGTLKIISYFGNTGLRL